jgi:hypothetical protein
VQLQNSILNHYLILQKISKKYLKHSIQNGIKNCIFISPFLRIGEAEVTAILWISTRGVSTTATKTHLVPYSTRSSEPTGLVDANSR